MKEETVKWKRHYGVWKGTCDKKPIGSIKSTNTGYVITQADGRVLKLQGFLVPLSMIKLMLKNSYLIQKEYYDSK